MTISAQGKASENVRVKLKETTSPFALPGTTKYLPEGCQTTSTVSSVLLD